ncbi:MULTISPECIES: metallophosphoesterase [unclassified Pseudomonas]|uniref:metallophosphoesterase family protein n=1 Tax=unclassified Pseudomonas TaxID=196821 RepID=UPI000CD04F64|nr:MULTISPECIES: metallophosphoesterase [unclassified Pseudomonas]POA33436.1 phosphoesterase [Pseudomonas sp. GW456-R21]POA70429.1 phosphoesterase [Pseudomonas sp. GW460-R15]
MTLYKERVWLVCLALALVIPVVYGASSAETPRHMVFVSDSQYPWTDLTDDNLPDPNKEARSKELIELQYSDISSFRKLNGGASRIPVMINGDITAFGHGGERSYMKSVFENKLEGLYDYGLGNHDYANNVDDCFLNSCAAGSVNDLKERYWGKVESMDLAARSSGVGTIFYGSLAYSKNVGDVHMVQLNNEPTYTVSFTSGNPFAPTVFEITPALDWLEGDLKSAREQGKIIILNMHKVFDWKGDDEQIARFQQMLEKYRVTAVFGGHDHWGAGTYFDWGKSQYFGDVPVFLSGSASQQTYLIASFTADRQSLAVSVVRNSNWPSRKLDQVIPVLK